MKSILGFVLALVISVPSYSQITITNADMPSLNDTVRTSNTIDQWSIDVNQTGSNFNWDFSFLTALSQNLDTFKSVTSTPFVYQLFFNNVFLYPNHKADYAVRGDEFDLFGIITVTNVFNFYKNGNDKYKNVGFGANINGLPASVRNNPIDTVYSFPLTAGGSYTSYSEFEINLPGTFYLQERKTVSSAVVDGYGVVTIPMGSYPCIRVKMVIDISDSIYIDAFGFGITVPRPTEVQYHWLAAGMLVPVLQINQTLGVTTNIRYQDVYIPNVSVPEISNQNLQLYPNPANAFFILENPGIEDSEIQILDLNGKLVLTQNAKKEIEKIIVNTQELAEGIYVVKVIGKNSVFSNKMVIVRN